jgi:RHS repeat-associated protein
MTIEKRKLLWDEGTHLEAIDDNIYVSIYWHAAGSNSSVSQSIETEYIGNNVADATGAVQQVTHYYPYGKPISSMSNEQNLQPYKYSGKEQETMMGLTQYDFHARTLDYTCARFTTPDPLAEKYYSISPYAYCAGNPMRYIDPTGMKFGDYYRNDGVYLGSDGIDDNKVYLASGINADGSFENSQDLGITHTQFQTISNIVKHEGVTQNSQEYLWIAHTANNAAGSTGKLYSKLMSGYSSVDKSNKVPLSTTSNSTTANYARAAVIDVMSGGADPTGGAMFWDGTDFIAWGLNSPNGTPQNKFEEYKNITISSTIMNNFLQNTYNLRYHDATVRYGKTRYLIPADVFSDLNNWSNGNFNYSTGAKKPYGIEATGTFGLSIFWKLTK